MACDKLHLTHQDQLLYKWGGKWGGYGCGACTAGMVGEADSCGKLLYTGAQIRAASNEPTPDPDSPGLNHTQTRNALIRLSSGRIDLDVRNGTSFAASKTQMLSGIVLGLSGRRKVLVDMGQAHGDTFAGNHDIAAFVIDGKPWIDDPLTGRWPTTWETLKRFCGGLVINSDGDIAGYGRAWTTASQDITADWVATIRPPKGKTFRFYVRWFVGVNADGHRVQTGAELRRTHGFHAACTSPRTVLLKSGNGTVSLVKVDQEGSPFDGMWISSSFARSL